MKITKGSPKELDEIIDKLPLFYRDMSAHNYKPEHLMFQSRNASFMAYDSGSSKCYFPYKPLSRLTYGKGKKEI